MYVCRGVCKDEVLAACLTHNAGVGDILAQVRCNLEIRRK
jgi:hypothetical protein